MIGSPNLPDALPLLPLSGVILLPFGKLPLNIFEARYTALVDEALGLGRMIGLIQPSDESTGALYGIGCMGRIVSFAETEDGRYLVNLVGVCRFRLGEELPMENGFRRAKPEWDDFLSDLQPPAPIDLDRSRLTEVLRAYFKIHGVLADWNVVENAASEDLIASLAMICPLPANEKQALLEAPTLKTRTELLIALLEMACLTQEEESALRH